MIVNPQLFNYRLITGSLIIAIAALTIVGYSNYNSAKAQEKFLEQEKSLITSELSQILAQYDDISVDNNLISSQLEDAKLQARTALDSVEILTADIAVYSKYRNQVANLRNQNAKLFKAVDSIRLLNESLEQQRQDIAMNLNIKEKENSVLKAENEILSEKILKAAEFTATNFQVIAFKSVKGKRIETRKAINASIIDVCLTLTENEIMEAGNKELYVQIVNPKNNVIADKGSVTFGDATLIFSEKNVVFYDNKAKDICVSVTATSLDKPLEKGLYYVNVFHKEKKIGSKEIILN